jgi:hypothetical protein
MNPQTIACIVVVAAYLLGRLDQYSRDHKKT